MLKTNNIVIIVFTSKCKNLNETTAKTQIIKKLINKSSKKLQKKIESCNMYSHPITEQTQNVKELIN